MADQATRPPPAGWTRISASLAYQDPVRAIDWLVRPSVFRYGSRCPMQPAGSSIPS